MSRPLPGDTLAALATAPGSGALAVVRMSGPAAIDLAADLFEGSRRPRDLDGFQGAHGWFGGPEGWIDEVVLWVYRAPRSYTGEDMVEVSCHGGLVSGQKVLEALWRAGARPAEPGEFTRRAFMNGKLDLTQAEAVALVVAARGRRAHEQALLQLQGGLSRRVRAAAGEVRGVLAEIEAHLDFGDDVPHPPDQDRLREVIHRVEDDLAHLLASHDPARRLRDGWSVALAGRPNVGKSSLLNALLGSDRALVHESPGTTRDVVDAWVEWDGIPIRLVDTAGVRETTEPVEQAGIDRTRREIQGADSVLWIVEAIHPPGPEDLSILASGRAGSHIRLIFNKIDLALAPHAGWGPLLGTVARHEVSALTGEGVHDLAREISRGFLAGAPDREGVVVSSERHARLLDEAASALNRAREAFDQGLPLELGAADLRLALDALADITGDRAGADLLDEIFRRFCVGK